MARPAPRRARDGQHEPGALRRRAGGDGGDGWGPAPAAGDGLGGGGGGDGDGTEEAERERRGPRGGRGDRAVAPGRAALQRAARRFAGTACARAGSSPPNADDVARAAAQLARGQRLAAVAHERAQAVDQRRLLVEAHDGVQGAHGTVVEVLGAEQLALLGRGGLRKRFSMDVNSVPTPTALERALHDCSRKTGRSSRRWSARTLRSADEVTNTHERSDLLTHALSAMFSSPRCLPSTTRLLRLKRSLTSVSYTFSSKYSGLPTDCSMDRCLCGSHQMSRCKRKGAYSERRSISSTRYSWPFWQRYWCAIGSASTEGRHELKVDMRIERSISSEL